MRERENPVPMSLRHWSPMRVLAGECKIGRTGGKDAVLGRVLLPRGQLLGLACLRSQGVEGAQGVEEP